MGNSLLELTPHQVSRDLKGYSVLFYGTPKSGKTTTASRFPGALVLAFEKGYSTIPGIMAKPMNSWGDYKKTLIELKAPEVQERFSTIVIDTVDIAYDYCEKHICNQEGVSTINEIPYGGGYTKCGKEFDEGIRKVLQLGYGLVLISHSTDKTFKDAQGEEYNQIVPTLDKRGRLICERTCDIIGFSTSVETDHGSETRLFMRGTPRFIAGSRFKYTPNSIVFSYQNLVDAIAIAIDKEAAEHENQYVTNQSISLVEKEKPAYDFQELINDLNSIIPKIIEKDKALASQITSIVESHLGKGRKVSECTEAQCELIDLIICDLKQLL